MAPGSTAGRPKPGVARVVQRERVVLARAPSAAATAAPARPWAGDDEVGQLALGRQREHALVARPVLADEARPIDRQDHRLVVLADVVDVWSKARWRNVE